MATDRKYKKLEIYKSTSKTYELQFKKNGAGTSITDWTIYFTVKSDIEDSDSQAVIAKTVADHDDPENGKTLIELTPSDTDLSPGDYFFSIDYKDDSNPANEGILAWGQLKIKDTVLDSRS